MSKVKKIELIEGRFYYCETKDNNSKWIYQKSEDKYKTSCTFCISDDYFGEDGKVTTDDDIKNLRVATNEEKQLLITQIKNHGLGGR